MISSSFPFRAGEMIKIGIDEIRIPPDDSLGKGESFQLCSRIDSNPQHGNDGRGIELIHQMKGFLNRLFILSRPAKEKIMAVVHIQLSNRVERLELTSRTVNDFP